MKYYIQDRRTYCGNSPLWWKDGNSGYTTRLDEAGLYTKEEAIELCKDRETDVIWPEDVVKKAAFLTVDAQYLDHLKIISKGGIY